MKICKDTNKSVMRAATSFKPWDYDFMLDIESKCLLEMAEYFEKSEIAVSDPQSAKYCRLMAKLLAIATDEDIKYYESPKFEFVPDGKGERLESHGEGKMKKHVNVNNAHRFMKKFKDIPIMRYHLRQQKAWYLYHKMRVQYLLGCWN